MHRGDICIANSPEALHGYVFGAMGRRASDQIVTPVPSVDGSVRRIYTAYNDAGLPYLYTSYADTAGTTIVNQVEDTYNGLGQVVREFQAVNGAVDTSSTPYVGYGYSDPSLDSRLTSMAYPNGRTIDYNYTGTNNNSSIDNAISRLDSISDGANTPDAGTVLEQYSYLGLSTIVQAAHPQTNIDLSYILQPGQVNTINDGGDQYVGLDRFGRVVDQNWWNTATQSSTDRFQYGYDKSSNVLFKNNLVNPNESELYHANSTQSGDSNSAYDPLSRETAFARGVLGASGNNGTMLDTITSPVESQAWNLDALGNWSSFTDNGTNQSRNFNSQNQITGITGTTTTPVYDANGNMTTDQNGNTLVYDAWNRLVAVKNASGQTIASYTYNAMGYRISETYPQGGSGIPAGTTKYLYYSNNWQVIETRWNGTAAADTHSQYVWSAMYIDSPVLRDTYSGGTLQAGERICFQHDANFNTTAIIGLVNGTWQVTQRYIYTPYGSVTVLNPDWSTATSQTPLTQYLHQGGRLDPATGLYRVRFRDYSPALGVWTQEDPAAYVDGGNLCQTLDSRPASAVDPIGLAPGFTDVPIFPPNFPPDSQPAGPQDWYDPETGENWHWHPEDRRHRAHWDVENVECPGHKQRIDPEDGHVMHKDEWSKDVKPLVKDVAAGGVVVAIGWGFWEGVKWITAIATAPETAGASLAGAAALP